MSQEEIAKIVKLPQHSFVMLIKKLKERCIIEQIIVANINKVGIYLAKVMKQTTDTIKILYMFRNCPFFKWFCCFWK